MSRRLATLRRLCAPSRLGPADARAASRAATSSRRPSSSCCYHYSTNSDPRPRASDPLRVLFCGSDEFSCESLRALHDEHRRHDALIRSIDVVVRPAKPTGRGYKVIREVPLQSVAQQLGLHVHERDTFTGWQMPQPDGEPINLIIAVSFGLFVPPRLLRAAKYGGLNVHPSLLPDLKGAAPLHYALLRRRAFTGVSLQTLSETAFDAGAVLARDPPLLSPTSGEEGGDARASGIPIPPGCTVAQLRGLLAPRGAALLVGALRAGLHVPPVTPLPAETGTGAGAGATTPLARAPKLTSADRQVRWLRMAGGEEEPNDSGSRDAWDARETALRARVLGPLWTRVKLRDGAVRRVILEDVIEAPEAELPDSVRDHFALPRARTDGKEPYWIVRWVQERAVSGMGDAEQYVEVPTRWFPDGDTAVLRLPGAHGCIRIGRVKVEGGVARPAAAALPAISEAVER